MTNTRTYSVPIELQLTIMRHIFINMAGDGAKAIPIKVNINDIDLSKAILNNLIFAIHNVC